MEVCLSQEEVRTRIGGESEVGEPGSACLEARSTTCERLSSRVSRLIGLERLSRLSRVTELPLAGLELSQRKPRGGKIREICLMRNNSQWL